MRITRLYVEADLHADTEILLPADSAHYLVSVLRAKTGQSVILFNNTGVEAQAVLHTIDRKQVGVRIGNVIAVERESGLAIHLAIGISRGERMDFVLQKSTELGVSSITPLLCERTEVKLQADRQDKKQQHWHKVIVSACEQSGRTRLPRLNAPETLTRCLAVDASEQRLVLHHRSSGILPAALRPASALLVIGPEGGLSENEIRLAEQAGCMPWTLGRMRNCTVWLLQSHSLFRRVHRNRAIGCAVYLAVPVGRFLMTGCYNIGLMRQVGAFE